LSAACPYRFIPGERAPGTDWRAGWVELRAGLDNTFVLVYSCCSHLEHRASVKRFVLLQFLNLRHSIGHLGRAISSSQRRYLTQTQNKHRHTSMPQVGFEPTIPAFERAKTVHALDRAANVIGFGRHREETILDPIGTRTSIPRSSNAYPVAIKITLTWLS
jgi:hypothetical protein